MRFTFALLPAAVVGHGMLSWPPPRNMHSLREHDCVSDTVDPTTGEGSGTCLWFNQGCQTGCSECRSGCGFGQTSAEGPCCLQSITWTPTLPDEFRTIPDPLGSYTRPHPWRSPGFAPMVDPCGSAGGGTTPGNPGNGAYPPPMVDQGDAGSLLPERTDVEKQVWKAGGTAEVAWDITANHGGGYAWRICPKERLMEGESCFQEHHLEYVSETSQIQFGDDWNDRAEIKAFRVRTGTNPSNSTWTMIPIPSCQGVTGGSAASGCPGPKPGTFVPLTELIPAHPEFKPTPGLYGFGLGGCQQSEGDHEWSCSPEEYAYWKELFSFNIIDEIKVPNVAPGEYVVSWRWDVEQTPQIWSMCTDVIIE